MESIRRFLVQLGPNSSEWHKFVVVGVVRAFAAQGRARPPDAQSLRKLEKLLVPVPPVKRDVRTLKWRPLNWLHELAIL